MKFVLVGGTGSIGKAIAGILDGKGYSYSNISRNLDKSRQLLPTAANHCDFSESNKEQYLKLFEEAEAIINLAGSSIADKRWTESYKKEIYNSRINTTRKITQVLNNFPDKEKVLISTSAIGYYGDRQGELLDEHSSAGNDFLASVCVDWEAASNEVLPNIRVVNPRLGVVLDKDSGALAKMILPFKLFAGGPLGSGKQWFSWIHIEDLARLYVEMAENDRYHGAFNAVAPNPVQMNEFAHTLGKVMRRPSFFRVPEFALRLILGESASMVLASQKVSSQHLITKMFQFKFSELAEALQ
jgi:hypothetical protein